VATDVSGAARNIVLNGQTGFLVRPNNVLELTESLEYLLNNDDKSKKMGAQARERVVKLFSIQNTVAKIENLYSKICAKAD
jgi:glycosyltransferase involved in cell wall biosynthesis